MKQPQQEKPNKRKDMRRWREARLSRLRQWDGKFNTEPDFRSYLDTRIAQLEKHLAV